jgi:hypothetical protein
MEHCIVAAHPLSGLPADLTAELIRRGEIEPAPPDWPQKPIDPAPPDPPIPKLAKPLPNLAWHKI